MGEYGSVGGHRVKLGTCEDMLYLRADQTGAVAGSDLDFRDAEILAVVRFRFPWPDEDGTPAGGFGDPFRGLALWGVPVPEGVDHGLVQFSARNGYLWSVPCPEGPDAPPGIGRNGYGGACSLIQQAWRGGRLVGIARCNGCERAYRLEDGHELEAAVAIRSAADGRIRDRDNYNRAAAARGDHELVTGDNGAGSYHAIADRLLAGYQRAVPA